MAGMKNIIFLGIFMVVFTAGCTQQVQQKILKPGELCFENGKCISIEYAITPEERSTGLMYRNSLGKNAGMLFVFEQDKMPNFWMKNVKFPLDFVWIDGEKRIVDFTENVPVCTDYCPGYSPKSNILYVLEVNKGFVAENMLKTGQKADFLVVSHK